MERRKSGEGEYGFTLIELLIVIIVLGILAAIVVFSLSGVSGESKTAACTTDAKSVEVAADAYLAATGNWPTGITTQLVGSYLHTAPLETNGYKITLGGKDVVDVAVPATGTPAPFSDATGCPAITS